MIGTSVNRDGVPKRLSGSKMFLGRELLIDQIDDFLSDLFAHDRSKEFRKFLLKKARKGSLQESFLSRSVAFVGLSGSDHRILGFRDSSRWLFLKNSSSSFCRYATGCACSEIW